MAFEVITSDCTAVHDLDLEEMAAMCEEQPQPFSLGLLSKETESWVQLTRVFEKGNLKGFSFYTLERLGGTPCIIMGATSITQVAKRSAILKHIIKEQLKKALMAFPDEDVLVGARLTDFLGLEVFTGFVDIVPRPGHKSSGEETAWGKRLATKYGVGAKAYDSSTSIVKGTGEPSAVVDFESLTPEKLDKSMKKLFKNLNSEKRDNIIIYGWAKAKYLLKNAGK